MAARRSYDVIIFVLVLVLSTVGLIMIYSASAVISQRQFGQPYHFLQRQAAWLVVGFAVMAALMRMDYRRLRNPWVAGVPLAIAGILLLGALFSAPINSTSRWVRLGPLTIQPSEPAKLALLLFMAWVLSRSRPGVRELRGPVLVCLASMAAVAVLVAIEPDMGTAMTIAAVSFAMLFAAGIHWVYIASPAAMMSLGGIVLLLTNAYQRARLRSFWELWFGNGADLTGSGYQASQSVIAIATGGLTGRGLGEGAQKLFFLPYPHTDFIFSNVGEELGFIGAAGVVLAFLILLARGLRIAASVPDRHLALLAFGVTVMLAGQAAINIGVCLALLPTKGLPLPFLSYGGSSLVTSMAGAGLLLNASQYKT
ncbi:MAG TPA: putative lipid II flippase FtsW [Candidatus Saccharimonadales bacterium]|nr:putative lipid II flippase FtsW [Candidatus Saccharimonadales bacterium]